MANDHTGNSRLRPLKSLTDIGGRAAAATLRPLVGAVGAAAEAGIDLEQRTLDRLLESGEFERLLDSERLQAIVAQVVGSDGATQSIDKFFDSGLFDQFIDRLLFREGATQLIDKLFDSGLVDRLIDRLLFGEGATQLIDKLFDSGLVDRLIDRLLSSDGLWRLIDEIAASPTVRAAVSQQGLGFADQVGDSVRSRSRKADRRLERAAGRLARRHPPASLEIPTQDDDDGQPNRIV
jgi:hypothetical protein